MPCQKESPSRNSLRSQVTHQSLLKGEKNWGRWRLSLLWHVARLLKGNLILSWDAQQRLDPEQQCNLSWLQAQCPKFRTKKTLVAQNLQKAKSAWALLSMNRQTKSLLMKPWRRAQKKGSYKDPSLTNRTRDKPPSELESRKKTRVHR